MGRRAERQAKNFQRKAYGLPLKIHRLKRFWFCAYLQGRSVGAKSLQAAHCPACKLLAPSLYRFWLFLLRALGGGGGLLRFCFATRSARRLRKPPQPLCGCVLAAVATLPQLPAPPPPPFELFRGLFSPEKIVKKYRKMPLFSGYFSAKTYKKALFFKAWENLWHRIPKI